MRTPKPEPIPIDPDRIAREHARTSTLLVKECSFDFPDVRVLAWVLVTDGDQPTAARWTTYNGTLSRSKPRPLDLDTLARPVVDVPALLAKLEKKGFTTYRPAPAPAPEAPKRRRGRPRKGAAR